MANTKLDRIERDIEKTRAKILEQQKKLKDLEAQKVEEENAQIVQMVKAVHLDGTQLAAFLSAYASGEITLPQPEATYPAEQEDNDNEDHLLDADLLIYLVIYIYTVSMVFCQT